MASNMSFDEQVQALREDPRYQMLHQGDDPGSGVLATQNIRIELKRAFPGVRFSVRKSGYGTVNVRWVDGPSLVKVDELLGKYQAEEPHPDDGRRLRAENQAWVHAFGGASYVSTARDHSRALVAQALAAVYDAHGVPEASRVVTPEAYLLGEAWRQMPGSDEVVGTLVYRDLRHRDGATVVEPSPSPSL